MAIDISAQWVTVTRQVERFRLPANQGPTTPPRTAVETHRSNMEKHIVSASNGSMWRFQACGQHDEAFRQLLRSRDQQHDRFGEERELFNFFANARATIECTAFCLFSVGAIIDENRFPLVKDEDLKNVSVELLSNTYGSVFGSERISPIIGEAITEPRSKFIKRARIMLFHRAAPTRTMSPSVAGQPDVWGFDESEITPALTQDHYKWVEDWLGRLLTEADAFCRKHLPK
jgi:hypothetical protein